MSGDDLGQAALAGQEAEDTLPYAGGELARVAVPLRNAQGTVRGAVIASTFIPVAVTAERREVQERYEKYRKAESFKEPIKAVYLSLYLFPALLILFGPVWLYLYLARRITTPLRLVAEGAERIAAGERGVRVNFPSGDDEFSALIASFNRMSERLARSEEEVEHTRAGLTRKNEELEDRRRLMETVLETVGTGVVVVDAEGAITALNAAACRLLDVDADRVGRSLSDALAGPGRDEIVGLVQRLLSGRGARQEREVVVPGRGRDRNLAVTVVALPGAPGSPPGAVRGLEDLTPLMRAQKVAAWGEVARKLAHEIKNPLTPIQLSAQRVRKAYLKSAPDFEKVLTECTGAIVAEVDALKNLVDEFAQFARLPAANLVAGSLHDIIEQTLSLYDGLFGHHHGAPAGHGRPRSASRSRPDEARPHQPRGQRDRRHGHAGEGHDLHRVRSLAGARPAGGGRRRPRHPAGYPRQALRAALLDQEARERSRPGHRQPHRSGAPRSHPGGGDPSPWRPVRDRAAHMRRSGVRHA